MTLEEFFSIVDSIEPNENGCKIWPKGTNNHGYAQFYINGTKPRRPFGGHRVVLERKLRRKLNKNMFSCHKCDVRNCVNEDHLWEAYQHENNIDRHEKGRTKMNWGKGNKHPMFGITGKSHNRFGKSPGINQKFGAAFSNFIRHVQYWGA